MFFRFSRYAGKVYRRVQRISVQLVRGPTPKIYSMKNSTCRFTIVYYLPLKLSNFFYILETTHMHTIHTYVHMFFLRFSVEYEICFKNKLCLSPKKENQKKYFYIRPGTDSFPCCLYVCT